MIKCKICDCEFDESKNEQCPDCGEKYYIISLTDYQKMVEEIQNEQYRIEQIYKQVNDLRFSSNQFKNTLQRESNIYCEFKVWFDLLMQNFNIPKKKDYWGKPHYIAPCECQMHHGKICNGCGDC